MMTDDKDQGERHAEGAGKKDARQDRLKLALRENLKRRKSQARGRGEAAKTGGDSSPPDRGETKPGS
jgi:hypothetical protein